MYSEGIEDFPFQTDMKPIHMEDKKKSDFNPEIGYNRKE